MEVSFNLASGRIICSFLNQSTSNHELKNCTIIYGSPKSNCIEKTISSTARSGNVTIGIPLSNEYQEQPNCFSVIASNKTFTSVIKGDFIAGSTFQVSLMLMRFTCYISLQCRTSPEQLYNSQL